MQRITDLKNFVKTQGSGNLARVSRLLGVSETLLGKALESTDVMDVYRHTDMSYGLFTLKQIK